jgi:mannose-6-phosphate isomerase-like protein (cupin superfamily)
MNISRKTEAKRIKNGKTMIAYEYPVMNKTIHGAIIELNGRYPEKGRVVNKEVYELGFVIKGSGKIVIEDKEINFQKDDQLLIEPGQRYYWDAKATLFMPCSPNWYPKQHKQVK